jgi:hypothetical protein
MSIYNLAVDNQQPGLVEVRKSSRDKATEIEAGFISEVLEKHPMTSSATRHRPTTETQPSTELESPIV